MEIISLDQMKNLSIDEIINLYKIGYRLEENRLETLAGPIVDPFINFGKVIVSTGYSSSATTINLITGDGLKLPDPSIGQFNLVWWNSTDYSDPTDDPFKEIIRVTAKSIDTLTITRGQENTTPSNKNLSGKTYRMINALTSKSIGDLQTYSQSTVNTHASLASNIHNFDVSGNAPPQIHGKTKHDNTTVDGGSALSLATQIPAHGSAQHTGIVGDHLTNLSGIGTNTHAQIDTHIGSKANVHSFDTDGLLTQMPAVAKSQIKMIPVSGQGGSLYAHSDGTYFICGNCFYDGTNWQRFDTTKEANILAVATDGTLRRFRASAAANPITWNLLNNTIISDTSGGIPSALLQVKQPTDTVKCVHDAQAQSTSRDTFTKVKTIIINEPVAGSIRAKVELGEYMSGGGDGGCWTINAHIYHNGSPIGTNMTWQDCNRQTLTTNWCGCTIVQDLAVNIFPGDTIELWLMYSSNIPKTAYCRNWRLCWDLGEIVPYTIS